MNLKLLKRRNQSIQYEKVLMFPVPTTAAFEVVVTVISKATQTLRINNKKMEGNSQTLCEVISYSGRF